MHFFWQELRAAVPLITHGNPQLMGVIGFTLQVAAIATAAASVIGIPIGLALALGRFPGRGTLRIAANVSLGLPPVLVGSVLFIFLAGNAPGGALHLIFTRRVIFIAQTILALPFTVALTAAAVEGLPAGLLGQARLLGAGRLQLAVLATREARIGIMTGVIAALGSALSEVAAVAILGGNLYEYNQTLASATLYEVNGGHYPDAIAIAIVLIAMILVLMCALGLLQQQGGGLRLRFRPAT
jgi:tungstate transport system permease protein